MLGISISYRKRRPDGAYHTIRVRARPGDPTKGVILAGNRAISVALGRGGIRANKREGDGGTPRGVFRPKTLWFRADRHIRPKTGLRARPITPHDAWDEDPSSRLYNRAVQRRPDAPGDRLMRVDQLYDFIVEIDHNTRPRVAGRGSAVFLHLARPGYAPTAGCVAMAQPALLQLLRRLGPKTRIVIG